MEEPQHANAKSVIHGITSMVSPRYIQLSFAKLFWIFVVGSILGLLIEDVFHVLVYHEWESRAGLVWGPFSPLYGVGAVVLTVFLNRFYYTHNLIIFLIAMVLGSAMEYLASLIMEVFWHAIAWDYSGTFGSIDGRTNFSAQVSQEVRRHFPGKVFSTVIPRNIRLAEAPSHGVPITAYDRISRGAAAYRAMAEEIQQKL